MESTPQRTEKELKSEMSSGDLNERAYLDLGASP
jgi:hypothetical protein